MTITYVCYMYKSHKGIVTGIRFEFLFDHGVN